MAIFKDGYRTIKITSAAKKRPMLTVRTWKTDHLGVLGVDDMTVTAVQGSGFRGSKVKAKLDGSANVFLNR